MTTHAAGRKLAVQVRHVVGFAPEHNHLTRYATINHAHELAHRGSLHARVYVGNSSKQVDGFEAADVAELARTLQDKYGPAMGGNTSNHVVYVACKGAGALI